MNVLVNLKWTSLSQIVKIAIQLISLTVLTRLVSPKEYGLMAMATIVINLVMVFRDLGTSAAIIQKNEITEITKSTIFWLNVFMGTFLCILIIALSPFIAQLFNEPRLQNVLILVSVSFPVASAASVHQSLLERNSLFSKITLIEVFSGLVSLVTALSLAYMGYGVYSLVFQTLVYSSLSTILFWLGNHWRPGFEFSKKEIKYLVSFSGNLTLFNIINYLARNADGMIIGHKFSAALLGAYSLAYRIMLFPLQSLTFVAARSLYPVMSRLQNNKEETKKLYLKALICIATITAPMMAGIATIREPFILIIFGNKWGAVPNILFWLAPTGFIQSLVSITGSVFVSRGLTALQMKLGLFAAILYIFAFIIGSFHSLTAIAFLYFIANIIAAVPALYYSMKILGGGWRDILYCINAPLLCTAIMVLVISLCNQLIMQTPAEQLVSNVIVGVIIYMASYYFLFKNKLINLFN
jgi:O-antigen/teichoic acid export membrane protein